MASYVYQDGVGWVPLSAGSLPASGVAAGSYGDATHVGRFTVDSHGIITAASDVPITGGGGGGGDFTKLFDQTLGASAASIDTGAGAIPSGHSSLRIDYYARGDRVAVNDVGLLRFNADSGANYNWRKILLNTASVSGQSQTGQTSWEALWTDASSAADIFGAGRLDVFGYDSGHFPTIIANTGGMSDNAGGSFFAMAQGWYASTTPISRVSIAPSSGLLIAGSRLTVYGLA